MNILNQYIDLETNLGGVGQSNSWGGQTGPWGGRLPPSTGPNGASAQPFNPRGQINLLILNVYDKFCLK